MINSAIIVLLWRESGEKIMECEEGMDCEETNENGDFIYIADFTEDDRDLLLEYLWYSSGEVFNERELFDIDKAKYQINYNEGYAYVICGRRIDLYIYNVDIIDTYLYDYYNGCGRLQEIVDEVRYAKSLQRETTINGLEALFLEVKL